MPLSRSAGRRRNGSTARRCACAGDEIVVGVEARRHLALRDRVIAAVRHVLFARPDQLDRRARHLPWRSAPPADVVGLAAPAEAAAEQHLVDVALVGRQARGFQHRGERRLAVLRAAPDLAFVRRVERGGVHRLHRGVVLVGIAVDRLDLLGRAGDRRLRVAVLVADKGLRRLEAFLQHLAIEALETLALLAFVPDDRQRIERGLGVPQGVGDDRDRGVADRHHLLHAVHARDLGGVEALHACRRTPGSP